MRNTKILLLSASVLLAACNQKELTSGITTKNMDTLVKPGDNFAAYVNGAWMKTAKIPADKASYGAFDMLYDQSQKTSKPLSKKRLKVAMRKVQTNKKSETTMLRLWTEKVVMLKALHLSNPN